MTFFFLIGLAALLLAWFIVYFIFILIAGSIATISERKQKEKEKYDAMAYLYLNGWAIEYNKEENSILEYPQIFYKKYKNGSICVMKKKGERDLYINYHNPKNLNEKRNIRLHTETANKIDSIFKLDKI